MSTFEQAWVMSNTHYRVSGGVRVTIQRRAMNVYTYVEDFIVGDGIGDPVRRWKIRSGSIRVHGDGGNGLFAAKARAEIVWEALREEMSLEVAS